MDSAALGVALQLARLCLVAMFAIAAVAKVAAPRQTRRSLLQFGIPARFTVLVGIVLPACELSVALGLTWPPTVHLAASAALALLCVFTLAISANLWQGRRPECACFGGIRPSRIGFSNIARNLLLAAASSIVFASSPHRLFPPPGQPGRFTPAAGAVLSIILGVGLAAIAWLAFRRVRQDCTTTGLRGKRPVFRPIRPTGLRIGTRAPQFTLPSLDGGVVTLQSLIQSGGSALLVFASSACSQCAGVLPAIAGLQKSRSERINAVVIFSGDHAGARRIAAASGIAVAAVDNGRLAEAFRLPGVPAAVLIGPGGLIASKTASGARAVTNLVAQVSSHFCAAPSSDGKGFENSAATLS
jgi:hypothetical protein